MKKINRPIWHSAVSNPHWVTVGQQAQQQKTPFVVGSRVRSSVCKHSDQLCVSVWLWVLGSLQSQDTDGRNGVSRSTSSGQIIPMLFLLGSPVGGHRQSRLGLVYLTVGQRMKQRGSKHCNTTAEICSYAAYFLPCVSPGEHDDVRGKPPQ